MMTNLADVMDAISSRDTVATVRKLDEVAHELGADALLSLLEALQEPHDANFVRGLCVLIEAPSGGAIGFAPPADKQWDERAGAWGPA